MQKTVQLSGLTKIIIAPSAGGRPRASDVVSLRLCSFRETTSLRRAHSSRALPRHGYRPLVAPEQAGPIMTRFTAMTTLTPLRRSKFVPVRHANNSTKYYDIY
jgi:hypothetical protein